MKPMERTARDAANGSMPIGKAALIASVGGERGYEDWTNPTRLRGLLAEFLGMVGLTFILSGGAHIPARYGGQALAKWEAAWCFPPFQPSGRWWRSIS